MSLLVKETLLNRGSALFVPAPFILPSTITGDGINVNTVNAIAGNIENISSSVGYISTLETEFLQLDNAFLTANGSELLLNGIPIATTSNISSLADWSLDPAISTIACQFNDIKDVGKITGNNFNFVQGYVSDLQVFQQTTINFASSIALFVQDLTASTIYLQNDILAPTAAGLFSNVSSLTAQTGTLKATNLSSLTLQTGTLTATTINGQAYTGGSNWSQFPATSNVNMNGYDIAGGSQAAFTIAATSNLTETAGISYCNVVDRGVDITGPALMSLNAKNGLQGSIAITADPGFNNGVFGRVDITANGGSLAGVGSGGLININANTPLGFSNLTSAVKINAAGINSYAGAIPSVASLAGYNFIYGTAGVNITTGIPSIFPNIPGTTYLYGVNGVVLNSDVYTSAIQPYWDGVSASNGDLLISGRTLNLTNKVYVNLSNVKYMDMDFFAEIRGVKGITFCNSYASNFMSNVNTFAGANTNMTGIANITGTGPGTLQGFTNVFGVNGNFITSLTSPTITATNLTASNTLSTTSLNISSINGFNMSQLINTGGGAATNKFSTLFTSTLAFSTMTSVGSNTNFNYPILLDYDQGGNSNAGVAIAVQGHNFGSGAVVNRIEMGARGTGANYIASVWPGIGLEDLYIDATDTTFNDGSISTIINSDPYSIKTSAPIQIQGNAVLSGSNLNVSTLTVSSIQSFSMNKNTITIASIQQPFIQWGNIATSGNNGNQLNTLSTPYSNTSYVVQLTPSDVGAGANLSYNILSPSTFQMYWTNASGGTHTVGFTCFGNL
jgi:hypothetical protein